MYYPFILLVGAERLIELRSLGVMAPGQLLRGAESSAAATTR